MPTTDAAKIRDHLLELDRSRARVEIFPDAYLPANEAVAYAAQALLCQARLANQGPVVGYKVGLTSPQIRQQTGLNSPILGPIHASNIHVTPATFAATRFVRLGLELEICVRMGRDLGPSSGPHDKDSVAPAVAELMPSFELIEDRAADYAKLNALALIADGGWNGGIVIGRPTANWRGLDLARLTGTVTINGTESARGLSGEVMEHCFNSLAWAANHLAAQGQPLRSGMVVMTGSMVRTQFPRPGQTAVGRIETLGEVSVTLG